MACRKRYVLELGNPRCAPGVNDHDPGGSSQGGYMPMGCLIRHSTQRLGKPATRFRCESGVSKGKDLDGSTQPTKETRAGHVGLEKHEQTSLRGIATGSCNG